VFYAKHTAEETEKYLGIADKFGLLVTGGSDCHGRPHRSPDVITAGLRLTK
jgi:hypothetical protein